MTWSTILVAVLAAAVQEEQQQPEGVHVVSVEVTQGIQVMAPDVANTLPLVAGRSTAVRVTMHPGPGDPLTVTGRLRVFAGGNEVTPEGGLPPVLPLVIPAAADRNVEQHTLNFEVLPPTRIPKSDAVDLVVEVFDETSGALVDTEVLGGLRFVEPRPLRVFHTRVDFVAGGLGLPDPATVGTGPGDAFLRGVLPVDDADPDIYLEASSAPISFVKDGDGDGMLDVEPEGNELLSLLASARQMIVDDGLGPDATTHLYGWVGGNPIDGNGLGAIHGRVGFGNTDPERFQRTFVHELGHNLGFGHGSLSWPPEIGETGFDVGARLRENPAANLVSEPFRRAKERYGFNDFMRPGHLTRYGWVSPATWRCLNGDCEPGLLVGDGIATDHVQRGRAVVVLQGTFDARGQALLRLEPVFRFPWASTPHPTQNGGPYEVVVESSDGGEPFAPRVVGFDALVCADTGGGRGSHARPHRGFFEVMVPLEDGARLDAVRVRRQGGAELGSIVREPGLGAVVLDVSSPQPGMAYSGSVEVDFFVQSAPGALLVDLQFQVAYSPDGGESFRPVAADLSTRNGSVSQLVSLEGVPPTSGAGVFRILASNGLDTSFVDVVDVTVQ